MEPQPKTIKIDGMITAIVGLFLFGMAFVGISASQCTQIMQIQTAMDYSENNQAALMRLIDSYELQLAKSSRDNELNRDVIMHLTGTIGDLVPSVEAIEGHKAFIVQVQSDLERYSKPVPMGIGGIEDVECGQ